MRRCAAALALAVLVTGFGGSVVAQSTKQYPREAVVADLTETYEVLKRHHPNFARHRSAGELQVLYENLLDELTPMVTRDQAYLTIATMVGAVCDEHTQVIKRHADHAILPPGWPWFDEQLLVRDGELYVEQNNGKSKAKVISINGVSGRSVAQKLIAAMPHDGCYEDGVMLVNGFLKVSGNIVAAALKTRGPFTVITEHNSTKARITRTLKPISPVQAKRGYRSFRKAQYRDFISELLDQDFALQDLGKDLEKADLTYFLSDQRKLAYLRIDSFPDPEKARDGIEKTMRDIIRRRPKALILDFTDNPGGYTESAQFLMAFLLPNAHRLHSRAYRINMVTELPDSFRFRNKAAMDARNKDILYFRRIKPKDGIRSTRMGRRSFGKPDYRGPIYVLVSPESHSNAINVATNLKRLRNAVIVGDVTAANTYSVCAAAQGSFQLKHTSFILSVPELCYSSPENKFAERGVLVPDVEVDIFDWPLVNMNKMILRAALEDFDSRN